MQPFFKLRLACAISTLPTTQAPRRLYYAARAGYVGAIKQLLAHGASATKVPVTFVQEIPKSASGKYCDASCATGSRRVPSPRWPKHDSRQFF